MLSGGWQADLYGLRQWLMGLQAQVVLPAHRQVVPEGLPTASPEGDADPDGAADADDNDDDDNDNDDDDDEGEVLAELAAGDGDDVDNVFAALRLSGDDQGTGADLIEIYSGRSHARTRVGVVRFTPELESVDEVGIEGPDQIRLLEAEVDRILTALSPAGLTSITLTFTPFIYRTDGSLTPWRQVESFTTNATRAAPTSVAPRFEDAAAPEAPGVMSGNLPRVAQHGERLGLVTPDPRGASTQDVLNGTPDAIDLMERALAPAEVDMTEHGAIHRMLKVTLSAGDRVTRLLAQQVERIQHSYERALLQVERTTREVQRLQAVVDNHAREIERIERGHELEIMRKDMAHQLELNRIQSAHAEAERNRDRKAAEDELKRALEEARREASAAKKKVIRAPAGDGDESDGIMSMIGELVVDKLGGLAGGGGDSGGDVDYGKVLTQLRTAPPQKVAMGLKLLKPRQREATLRELAKQDRMLALKVIDELTRAVETLQNEEDPEGGAE